MKRLDLLIEEARSLSENTKYNSSGLGISQDEFVRFANHAQDDIMRETAKVHPAMFLDEEEITVVPNQEAYSLPANMYLGHIAMVEYSQSGLAEDYRRLPQLKLQERQSRRSGQPCGYIRAGERLLLVPNPGQAGSVRITFVKKRGPLDIQRCATSSITGTTSITGLTLSTSDAAAITHLKKLQHLSLVNAQGEMLVKNIKYTAIDAGTGVVTLFGGSHALGSGESVPSSALVVGGYNAVNTPSLPDICEQYLIDLMVSKAKVRDSKMDRESAKAEAKVLLSELVGGFADTDDDISEVTITDLDYLVQY